MKFINIFITLVVFSCFNSNLLASLANEEQPILLDAESAQIDNNKGLSIYKGNVSIKQGDVELTGDIVFVYTKNRRITKIVSKGSDSNQAYFKEGLNSQYGLITAWAKTITFDVEKRSVCLEKNAKVKRFNETFYGAYILYNEKLKTVTAHGDTEKVKFIFYPVKKIKKSLEKQNSK